MKHYLAVGLLVLASSGCCSWAHKHCTAIIQKEPMPYPVPIPVACTKPDIPPELVLGVYQLPDSVAWEEAVDTLIRDLQAVTRENQSLRKELGACGTTVTPTVSFDVTN